MKSFVSIVLSDRSNTPHKLTISEVSLAEANRLKKNVGFDCKGYKHIIDSYGIRHVFKRHSDKESENQKGLIAIVPDDFELIPGILKKPDKIYSGGKSNLGKEVIVYEKRINGFLIYMAEIRTRQKELALLTMYKKRTGS